MIKWIVILLMVVGCSKKKIQNDIVDNQIIEPRQGIIMAPRSEVKEVEIVKEPVEEVEMWEPHNIQFEFDNYQLGHTSIMVLGDIAEEMRTNPNMKIIIGGHTCPIGTYEYNLSLSEARANAAKNYLMTIGISDERIETMSYGEERLLNDNPANYWVNRRDTFFLVRK